MATTIVKEISHELKPATKQKRIESLATTGIDLTAAPTTQVTPEQIKLLSDNFFLRVGIMEDGAFRRMDCSNPANPPKQNDTKRVYFDKVSLDGLFIANPGSDGLLIYFGVHDHNLFPVAQPEYDGKVMVVLVSATTGKPNLAEGNVVQIAGAPGEGLDNGKLCPPNTTCG